jgi:predicted PurR-regulated permease PerM
VQSPPPRTVTEFELPFRTIVRVIFVLILIWLLQTLWNVILLLMIAIMLTAALDPLVRKLQDRGMKRSPAVGVVTGGTILVLLAVLAITITPLITQSEEFVDELPAQVDRVERILDERYPRVLGALRDAVSPTDGTDGNAEVADSAVGFGMGLISFIADAFVVIVFTIYLLLDGKRIYRWCVRYVPNRYRRKMDRTIPEVSRVVSGYVTGQLITSTLFAVFSFAVLYAVGVPQPLFLALLAGIGDAIPIVGVTVVTIPTVLLALTVSPTAAIIVLTAYLVYQQIENYFIVPRIYKTTLDISSFSVLIAVLIGSSLLGIVGALLALPIAAAIPVIEDIWLEDSPLRQNLPPPVELEDEEAGSGSISAV